MRLIDADKLRLTAEERMMDNHYVDVKVVLNHRSEWQTVINIINAQPTAYSMDKVVEQLVEASEDTGFTPEQILELVKKYSWHKVADGDLPTHSNRVLVYIKYKASHRIPPHRVANYAGEKWWYSSDREITGEAQVIAWMELPEYEVPMIDCKIE